MYKYEELLGHYVVCPGFINNPKLFIKHINSRILNNEDYLYSTMIRKMRLKKRLTIQEVSQNVCSISYLSKLENGNITSNDLYLRGLFEKLDVDIDDFRTQNSENNVKLALKYYFYDDFNNLESLFKNTMETPLNIYVPLIRSLYYLYLDNFEKVEEELKSIEPIKDTFGKYEATLYFFIVIEYYIKTYNYSLASDYLRYSDMLNIDEPILNSLLLESKIIVSTNLKNFVVLFNSYKKYNDNLFTGYPIGRLIKIKLLYNLSLIREEPEKVLDDIETINIDSIPNKDKLDIIYLKTLIKLNYCNYEDMFKELINQKNYKDDARFLAILAYLAYSINKNHYFHKVLEISEKYNFLEKDYIHHKFIFFVLLYASNATDEDVILYLRKEINDKNENIYFDMYNHIYRNVYLAILTDQSRYKEAYLYLNAKFIKNEREERRRMRSINLNKI